MHKKSGDRRAAAFHCRLKAMNLKEMAKEYCENAEKIKQYIAQLRAQDVSDLPYGERVKREGHIRYLEGICREVISTARYLEEYYRLQNRCDRE